ncbi:MAG TPA: phage tail protein, partial [Kofleriaceae bacterium]|nr:phage tail protein [Kofleriaceae bacterium]
TRSMMLGRKSYSAGHFLFQIDESGEGAAYVKSVSGGMVKGAVLEDQAGPVATQFKHVGAVEIDPIQIEIGMALSKPLLEWIRGSWRRQFSRRSGSVIHADFDFRTKFEQWFEDALITETKFPTLDGSAKEPAYLSVTLQPERVKPKAGDGSILRGNHGIHQKLWQPCNFRLDIQGVDCSYVNRIDSFSVTQRIKPLYTGSTRFPEVEPTGIDFSNLVVYIGVEHADDFMAWYEQFIVRGDKDTRQERDGFLEFMAPDGHTVLFTINLNRLGIHKLSVEKSEANSEQIKRYKIELYLESMELEYSGQYMK